MSSRAVELASARTLVAERRLRIPPLLLLTWAAIFANVMAFNATTTLLPIAGTAAQLLTQAALVIAGALALLLNPKGVLRPHLFLVVCTVLVIEALAVSIHNQFFLGSTFRAARFAGFIAVLWLVSPWFGRRDMVLLRCHRICLGWVLAMVVVGAVIAPGLAFSFDGRLSGVIWPIPPTQVAHYAALALGTTALLWLCRIVNGRYALSWISASAAILVATHTRTALVAMCVALVVAASSLFLGNSRVRRTSLWSMLLVLGAILAFANEIKTWAFRGQSTQEAGQLSGRTDVWSAVIHTPRPMLNDVFGSGMSNLSFNGLPIDSNWVGAYLDLGWFGVLIDAGLLIMLLVVATTQPRSPHRAIALFLIIYCIFASVTETGMSNPSPYFLDLAVAASLILPRTELPR